MITATQYPPIPELPFVPSNQIECVVSHSFPKEAPISFIPDWSKVKPKREWFLYIDSGQIREIAKYYECEDERILHHISGIKINHHSGYVLQIPESCADLSLLQLIEGWAYADDFTIKIELKEIQFTQK